MTQKWQGDDLEITRILMRYESEIKEISLGDDG